MQLQRSIHRVPGYDERPRGCHPDEILLSVSGEHADGRKLSLVLTINTGRYPTTVEYVRKPDGSDLSLHVQGDKNSGKQNCFYVPCCEIIYTTALGASEMWKRYVGLIGEDIALKHAESEDKTTVLWDILEEHYKKLISNPSYFAQPNEPAYLADARARLAETTAIQRTIIQEHEIAEKAFAEACKRYTQERGPR